MAASSIKCSTSYTLVHVQDGTGVTITGKSVQYASSTSGTTTPSDSAWKDSVPSVSAGSYLWTRTIVTYSDGNSTTAYSVAYMGKNGEAGKTGAYTLYQYYASTSDTTQTGGSWSSTMPSIAGTGKYLWMRSKTVPAGGSESDVSWGNAVVAGTDISALMTKINTVDSQVSQNTASISANATAIATKVSTDTFDDLSERVGTAESNITQNADNIALKVSTTDYNAKVKTLESSISGKASASDVSALTTRVANAESSIKTNSDSIALKVSQTDYDTKVSELQSGIDAKADSTTVSELSSSLEMTNSEISLNVVKVSGSATDGTGQLVVGSSYIKLNAPQILVDGSVTAQQIDTDSLMAQTLTVKDGGKIQSENYDPEADAEGFSLSSSGILQADKAVLNDVKITKGELDAPSLKTLNAQQSGSWSATGGFPTESGTGTHAVKVVKTGETSGTSVGTLTTTHTPTGYYKGKDFAQWCLDNIPVDYNNFTKLSGTVNGYNAYAMRFDSTYDPYGSTGSKIATLDVGYNTSATTTYDFVTDGKYYRLAHMRIWRTSVSTGAEFTITVKVGNVKTFVFQAGDGIWTLDGVTTSWVQENSEYYYDLYVQLPPSDLTMTFTAANGSGFKSATLRFFLALHDIYSVYSPRLADKDGILLMLYSGTDDSKVFDPDANCPVIQIGSTSTDKNLTYLMNTTATDENYYSLPMNITSPATLICGTGLTGWTLTRYEKFLGLYEVGKKNESTGNVEWVSAPALRENGIYKSTAVYIDGTLYQKGFTISWSGTILSVVADDGSVSKVYSTDAYYTDFSAISFCELAYDVGTYVSDLFPMSESSNVGSVSQPFNEIHATNINVTGNITGNVKGNVTGDTTGTHIGNVNGDSSGVNANAASYVVWGAVAN